MTPSIQNRPTVSILIVEDSPTQAMLLENILEKQGHTVTSVRNGLLALASLRESAPDMVISDIQMPEMNGYELCLEMKGDAALRSVPVMLLTSLSAPQDIIRGLECGADNFVVKPYDEAFLISRIQSVLENSELRKQVGEETAIPVYFAGERYFITANRLQILNLLLSTYETAVKTNLDLIKAHEDLKAAQAQLIQAEKLQSVGRLAAGMAHEVKNPLAIMEMGISFLSELKTIDEASAGPVLAEMKEAVRRANTVINGLMDYSEAGDAGVRSVDLHAVIDQALEVVANDLERSHVAVVREFSEGLPCCLLDANRIDQLFANLFTNACHAMPNGGTLSIRTSLSSLTSADVAFEAGDRSGVRVRAGDQAIVVEIRDTGVGIAEENMSKLFDPFFSTKPTGKGTGLGLTVAKKIIEMHGGRIEIRNRVAGGARVKLTLPFRTSPNAA